MAIYNAVSNIYQTLGAGDRENGAGDRVSESGGGAPSLEAWRAGHALPVVGTDIYCSRGAGRKPGAFY